MFRSIKNRLRRARMVRDGVGPDLDVAHETLGSAGACWTLCPDGLDAASVVYSVGVGGDISFDLALIERFGLTVHAFDPTPRSVAWVEAQELPEGFVFHPYGLAAYDGTLSFYAPRKTSSAHFTPVDRYGREDEGERIDCPVKRLATLTRELGHDRIDLLKIDIEGGEYEVLPDILASGIPIGQLLLEFHHCYRTIPYARTREMLRTLGAAGYRVFHVSDRTYEVSLLHRD